MSYGKEVDEILAKAVSKAFEIPEIANYVHTTNLRILIVGTNDETNILREQYGLDYEGKTVTYSSVIYRFWNGFFGSDNLWDISSLSTPEKIISTGRMRSYELFAETVEVTEHLQRISEKFGISLQVIPFSGNDPTIGIYEYFRENGLL